MNALLNEDASIFARALVFSGLIGLAVGFLLEGYRLVLLDPVLGSGTSPRWVVDARFMLLVGSLVALAVGVVVDELFPAYFDVISLGTVLGQWGVPVGLFLHARYGGASSVFSYFALVTGGFFAVITAATAINYVRYWWPNGLLRTRVQTYWNR